MVFPEAYVTPGAEPLVGKAVAVLEYGLLATDAEANEDEANEDEGEKDEDEDDDL